MARSYWLRALARFLQHRVAVASLIVLVVLFAAGLLAPRIAPYGYQEPNLQALNASPSWSHPFGADQLGRDYFSRTLYGFALDVGEKSRRREGGRFRSVLLSGSVWNVFGKSLPPRWSRLFIDRRLRAQAGVVFVFTLPGRQALGAAGARRAATGECIRALGGCDPGRLR